MIEAGIGISILPLVTLRKTGRDRQLWRFPIEDCSLRADLYFVSNPQADHSPAEQAFLQVVDEVISAMPDAAIAD